MIQKTRIVKNDIQAGRFGKEMMNGLTTRAAGMQISGRAPLPQGVKDAPAPLLQDQRHFFPVPKPVDRDTVAPATNILNLGPFFLRGGAQVRQARYQEAAPGRSFPGPA